MGRKEKKKHQESQQALRASKVLYWGKLKMGWLYGRIFKTRTEAKKSVFEYIELFYNRHYQRRSILK
jgi:hypothetical protein